MTKLVVHRLKSDWTEKIVEQMFELDPNEGEYVDFDINKRGAKIAFIRKRNDKARLFIEKYAGKIVDG